MLECLACVRLTATLTGILSETRGASGLRAVAKENACKLVK